MSSEWTQLWTPQPLCQQSANVLSVPVQYTSSSHIGPVPLPYWFPRVRPTYLQRCSVDIETSLQDIFKLNLSLMSDIIECFMQVERTEKVLHPICSRDLWSYKENKLGKLVLKPYICVIFRVISVAETIVICNEIRYWGHPNNNRSRKVSGSDRSVRSHDLLSTKKSIWKVQRWSVTTAHSCIHKMA